MKRLIDTNGAKYSILDYTSLRMVFWHYRNEHVGSSTTASTSTSARIMADTWVVSM
jgi:hypothetical protein